MIQQLTPTPLKGAVATSPGQRPGGELGANQRPTGAIEVQGERQSRTCSSYAEPQPSIA